MNKESDQIMHDVEEDNKAAVFQQIQLRRQLIICGECEHGFESVNQLESHVAQVHVGWLPFECRYCSTFKASESDIRTHTRMRHRGCEIKFIYSPDDRRRQRVNVIMQQSLSRAFPSTSVDSNGPLVFGTPARRSYEFHPYPMIQQKDLDPYSRRSMPAPPETNATPSLMAPPRAFYTQHEPMQQQPSSRIQQHQPMLRMPTPSRMAFQRPPEPTVPIINLADESDDSGSGKLTPIRKVESAPQVRDPSACQLCTLVGNSEAAQRFIQTYEKVHHSKSHLARDAPNRKPASAEVLQKLQQCFPDTQFALQPKCGVSKRVVSPAIERESDIQPATKTIALQKLPAPIPQEEGERRSKDPSTVEGKGSAQRGREGSNTAPSTVQSSQRMNVPCAECKQPVSTDGFVAHVRSCHMKGPHSKCSHCDFASDEKKIVERHCFSAHRGLSCKATPAPTLQQVEEKVRRCFGLFLMNADAFVTEAKSMEPTPVEEVAKTKNASVPSSSARGNICNLCKRAVVTKGIGRISHAYEHLLNDKGISAYKCLTCGFGSTTLAIMSKHRKMCPGSHIKVDKNSIKNEYEAMYNKCWN